MAIRNSIAAFLSLLLLPVLCSPVQAHVLGAEVKVRDEVIEVHAYYDDGTVARNAKVSIHDSAEKLMAEGRTDKKGNFTCPRPQPGKYVLEVNAGAGHLRKLNFTVRQGESKTNEEKKAAADLPFKAVDNRPPFEIVTDAPSKEEFTRFPWLKAGLGVAIIGSLCLALLVAVTVRRGQKPNPHQ